MKDGRGVITFFWVKYEHMYCFYASLALIRHEVWDQGCQQQKIYALFGKNGIFRRSKADYFSRSICWHKFEEIQKNSINCLKKAYFDDFEYFAFFEFLFLSNSENGTWIWHLLSTSHAPLGLPPLHPRSRMQQYCTSPPIPSPNPETFHLNYT